jgi:hypothetical protein
MSNERCPRRDPALATQNIADMEGTTLIERRLMATQALGTVFTPITERIHDYHFQEGRDMPEGPLKFFKVLRTDNKIVSSVPSMRMNHLDFCFNNLSIDVPIGPYGKEISWAIAQGIVGLVNETEEVFPKEESEKLGEKHEALIRDYVFFRRPLETVFDSATSTGHAFALAVNGRIMPGFENDPVGLLKHVVENDTINLLGRLLPFSWLTRWNGSGTAIVNLIDPNTLRLNSAIRDELVELQRKSRTEEGRKRTNFGCPVSYKNTPVIDEDGQERVIEESGINLVAQVLLDYVDHFYRMAADNPEVVYSRRLVQAPSDEGMAFFMNPDLNV